MLHRLAEHAAARQKFQPQVFQDAFDINRQTEPPFGKMLANRVRDLLQLSVRLGPVEVTQASGANTASRMALLSASVSGLRPSRRSPYAST